MQNYLPMMIDICRAHDIYMKQHNTDYLDDESLRWHPRLGIHAGAGSERGGSDQEDRAK